jgi:hypothetical protein
MFRQSGNLSYRLPEVDSRVAVSEFRTPTMHRCGTVNPMSLLEMPNFRAVSRRPKTTAMSMVSRNFRE